MNKVGRIIMIRHGETAWNAQGKAQGLADNPLNSRGRAQSSAAGRLVNGMFSPNKVWSSNLTRSVETASAVSENVEISPLLREMDLGKWDGLHWDALCAEFPEEVGRFEKSEIAFHPPGGESFQELFSRVGNFARSAKLLDSDGDIVVVAHAWVLASLISLLLGLKGSDACRFVLENGALAVIAVSNGIACLTNSNISAKTETAVQKSSPCANAKIVFIRHGETEGNATNMAQGVKDFPLNSTGMRQARNAATAVRAWFSPVAVWSSDLQRAAATAAAISDDVLLSESIREMDIGDWSGLLWNELEKTYPRDVERFKSAELKFRAPNGESFEELLQRVEMFVRSANLLTSTGDIVIVAHTWVLKAFFVSLLGFDSPDAMSRFPFRNGGISVVEVSGGFPRLTLMNAGCGGPL